MLMNVRKTLINDILFYSGGFQEFADFIADKFSSNLNTKLIIVHINLKNYYYLNKDKKFKDKIKNDCLCVVDGIGMKIGIMLGGYGVVTDLNGTDLFPQLIKKFISSGYGIFLLGADENVVQKTAKKLPEEYPGAKLSGFHNGYFNDDEEDEVIQKINNSKSDILIIGRGFPLQEQFVLKHKDNLRVSVIWNVGGLFDFLSGSKPRAPLVLRKIRLEWLYRFILEPGRMFHRNTVAAFWSLLHLTFNIKDYSR